MSDDPKQNPGDEPVTRASMTDLETKVAFIEATMQTLDERIVEQQAQLNQLEVWCKTLAKRMREAGSSGTGNDGYEVPPHY